MATPLTKEHLLAMGWARDVQPNDRPCLEYYAHNQLLGVEVWYEIAYFVEPCFLVAVLEGYDEDGSARYTLPWVSDTLESFISYMHEHYFDFVLYLAGAGYFKEGELPALPVLEGV